MDSKEYISSGILESYILGLASPEEAGILECVIKNNAEVKQAFEEAQITLEKFAASQAVSPPAELKAAVWSKIQQQKPIAEIQELLPEQPSVPERKTDGTHSLKSQDSGNGWKYYAVAASLLFLLSMGINLYWMNSQSEMTARISKLETEKHAQDLAVQTMQQKFDIVANPDMIKIVLAGVEKHPESKVTVFWDTKSKDVYVTANSLPTAPSGMQYQLWAIADGKPLNAGMYDEAKDSQISLSNIKTAQAFAITLEKEGGSEVPTMENIIVMGEV